MNELTTRYDDQYFHGQEARRKESVTSDWEVDW